MIAVKLATPYMPRLDTVNVPPPSSGGVIVPSRTRAASARVSRAISPSDFSSASNTVGTTSAPSAAHRHADVHARVQLQAPVAIAAVRARVLAQRQRAGLHDHVVVVGACTPSARRALLGAARAREPLELGAQRHARVHVDLDLQREVGDRRLRLGHPPRDRLLRARQLHGRSSGPWPSPRLERRRRRGSRRPAPPQAPAAARPAGAGRRRAAAVAALRCTTRVPPQHVGLHDPPARAAAAERVQVDAALAGDPPRQRRGLDARRPRVWRRRARGRRRRRAGAAAPTRSQRRARTLAGAREAGPSVADAALPARSARAAAVARPRARSARRPRACRPRRATICKHAAPGLTRRSWSPCRSRSRPAPRRARTCSPSRFSQRRIVPSSIVSDRRGITISAIRRPRRSRS